MNYNWNALSLRRVLRRIRILILTQSSRGRLRTTQNHLFILRHTSPPKYFILRLNAGGSSFSSPMISAPTKQILRAQLRSFPANGHTAYLPNVRKVVLEFCQKLPSSANTRTFISNDLERVAWQNPHVEFVVKQRNGHEPIARGFYGAVARFFSDMVI